MPTKARDTLVWESCRGRNGFDPPSELPDDMAAEAVDIVLHGLFAKRRGSDAQAISGDTFSGYFALYRFVPGQSEAAAELLIVSADTPTKILRVAAGTAAANLTLLDAVASAPWATDFATLNGKCYIAYDSTVNRLHVLDDASVPSTVLRVGLETPSAATVADTGAGTYAATLRYYRVQWVEQVAGTLKIASNLGVAVSFTPSGTGTHARVSRPSAGSAADSNRITHWRVWGSADGDAYFLLSTTDIAIATGTFDDNVAPSDYDDGDPAPDEGFFTPFPSVKYLLSTGDRLLGFGAWETAAGDSLAPRNGRVWFTPVLDSSDYDDNERVDASLGGFIDVSRDAGAEDRAIVGTLDNQILVGQSRGIYILIPTGNGQVPYRRVTASSILGMVSQKSSFLGEDEFGRPCIYFLDPAKGPYRYGVDGFQWLGYDVQDLWARISLVGPIVAHGVYDPETRKVIFALALDSNIQPTAVIVFDVREGEATQTEGVRYGWVQWTRPSNEWVSSVMFAASVGSPMSRNLKPYAGGGVNLLRYEDDASTDDNGTAFQAYATSKVFLANTLQKFKAVKQAYLQAEAAAGVLVQLSLSRDYGRETRVFSKSLSPTLNQTRVRAKYETAEIVDAFALQLTLGDAEASTATWKLDRVALPVEFDEEDR